MSVRRVCVSRASLQLLAFQFFVKNTELSVITTVVHLSASINSLTCAGEGAGYPNKVGKTGTER